MRFYRGRAIKLDYYRTHRSAYSKEQKEEPKPEGVELFSVLLFFFLIGLVICYNKIESYISAVLISLSVFFIVFCIKKIVFYVKYSKPLTENEILQLAQKRFENSVISNFKFSHVEGVYPEPWFKSHMNPDGDFYDCQIYLGDFPTYVSNLLKGKKHEWVVLAVSDGSFVKGFWANKGISSEEVCFFCSLEKLAQKADELNCNTIMRFHNHPNGDPYYTNCLLASDQDYNSACYCASRSEERGKSWVDFVCERGRFLKFYQNIVWENYDVDPYIKDAKKSNGVCEANNLELHKEFQSYGFQYDKKPSKKKKWDIGNTIILISSIVFVCAITGLLIIYFTKYS